MRAQSFAALLLLMACDPKSPAGASAEQDSAPAGTDTGAPPIDADGDGWDREQDCDDSDHSVHPDATEVCDGRDNNCDGRTDEGTLSTFFADSDGDGFGDDGASIEACSAPSGAVEVSGDCDDSNGSVHPGAAEQCDGVDNDCDGATDGGWFAAPGGYGSLQAAIDAAPEDSAVCIAPGTWAGAVVLTERTLTIRGAGAGETVLEGTGSDRVLQVSGGSVTLSELSIRGGVASEGAGVLATDAELVLTDLHIYDNACPAGAACMGAGVALEGVDGRLERVDIEGNATASDTLGVGLAIVEQSDVAVIDVEVSGNTASECGTACYGAVYAGQSTVSLEDVTITDNQSASTASGGWTAGSGLAAWGATVTGTRVRVLDNRTTIPALGAGGGFLMVFYGAEVWLENLVLANNSADGVGDATGAVYSYAADLTVENADIVHNTVGYGGALYIAANGSYRFSNVNVSDNHAQTAAVLYGGWLVDALTFSHCNFYGNTSDDGTDWYTLSDPTAGAEGILWDVPGHTDTSSAQASGWDLSLASGSALRDAGDPTVLDADGSRSDIGAYGGPGAW